MWNRSPLRCINPFCVRPVPALDSSSTFMSNRSPLRCISPFPCEAARRSNSSTPLCETAPCSDSPLGLIRPCETAQASPRGIHLPVKNTKINHRIWQHSIIGSGYAQWWSTWVFGFCPYPAGLGPKGRCWSPLRSTGLVSRTFLVSKASFGLLCLD